jgi:polyhydroxyalkanoate synthesis regulator phasin
MSEEKEKVSIATEREEREGGGPTSIDVIDNQISIGDVSFAEPQGEKVQDQNRGIERVHEESRSSKKRRITSYLSNISKQVDKHGNKIDKMTVLLQSLQKQRQTKSTTGSGVGQSQYQSIQQIKSQISQLQKQVARIQNDIRRIRTVPITRIRTKTKTKFRKLSPSIIAAVKPKSKRSKLLKSTKAKKRRRSRSRM